MDVNVDGIIVAKKSCAETDFRNYCAITWYLRPEIDQVYYFHFRTAIVPIM